MTCDRRLRTVGGNGNLHRRDRVGVVHEKQEGTALGMNPEQMMRERIDELSVAVNLTIELLQDLTDPMGHTMGMDADGIRHELREITAKLQEVR